MLLRRVIEHVREQNWTAIGIDLVIVVVGVFFGIQVANWNEARLTRDKAAVFTSRLQADLGEEAWRYRFLLAYYRDIRDAAARLNLAADPEAPVAHAEVLQALTHTRRYAEALALGERAERRFPDELDIAITVARIRALHGQDLEPLLALGRRFQDKVSIGAGFEIALARFIRDDIDGALTAIKTAGASRNSIAARRAAASTELLRLAGRTEEAGTLARAAYARLRQEEDVYAPEVGQANLAWLAAEARERVASQDLQAAIKSKPPLSPEEQYWAAEGLSGAQRALGDPEAAWLLLQPFAGDSYRLSQEHLTLFRPYYDRVFGASSSYRAYMAGKGKP